MYVSFQGSAGKSNNDDTDSSDDDENSNGPLVEIDDRSLDDGDRDDDVTDGDDGIRKLKLAPKKSAMKKVGLKRYPSEGLF